MKNEIMGDLLQHKIVVIYRGIRPSLCLEISKALQEVGVRFFEVTMNSPDALTAIERMAVHFAGNAYIGAGTVLKPEQVADAANAGSTYIISPNTNLEVISAAKKRGLLSIPGAFTATEIATAWEAGADMVKVFPISSVGGEYIKQIRGPFDLIPFMASGGVKVDIVPELAAAGFNAFGVGVQLIAGDADVLKDWRTLQKNMKAYMKAAGL